MCLIVAKPSGIEIVSRSQIHEWFNTHPDGFGIAYTKGNQVKILKGALDLKGVDGLLDDLYIDLKDNLKDSDIVFHFRQATDGSIKPENCHPFPVTKKHHGKLKHTTDMAVAHNGIIYDCAPAKGDDRTDTQIFVQTCLVGIKDAIEHPGVKTMITNLTSSRFAVLTRHGINYIGKFIEDNGYYYSNGGYKLKAIPWAYDGLYDYYNYSKTTNAECQKAKVWEAWSHTENYFCDSCGSADGVKEYGQYNDLLCDDCQKYYVANYEL